MRADQDPLRIAYDVDRWQRILNARPIPPWRSQRTGWVPVTARIVWERDGVEHLETYAFAWTHELVLVQLIEPRYRFRGVWLDPADVSRPST